MSVRMSPFGIITLILISKYSRIVLRVLDGGGGDLHELPYPL